jgi:hypothetical protein
MDCIARLVKPVSVSGERESNLSHWRCGTRAKIVDELQVGEVLRSAPRPQDDT